MRRCQVKNALSPPLVGEGIREEKFGNPVVQKEASLLPELRKKKASPYLQDGGGYAQRGQRKAKVRICIENEKGKQRFLSLSAAKRGEKLHSEKEKGGSILLIERRRRKKDGKTTLHHKRERRCRGETLPHGLD